MTNRYLPPPAGTLAAYGYKIQRRAGYDIWRRLLNKSIRKNGTDTRLVDCGCGPGTFVSLLERWYPRAHTVGLDLSSELLKAARNATYRCNFMCARAESLPLTSDSVDVLFALHVVEHLQHPSSFFNEAGRVLRPGGMLVFATPNPKGLGAQVLGGRWMGHDDEHVSLNPPDHWRALLIRHDLHILRDGTTGLSGIPMFRRLPLGIVNWGILLAFGILPWDRGEAYVCVSTKGDAGAPHTGASLIEAK